MFCFIMSGTETQIYAVHNEVSILSRDHEAKCNIYCQQALTVKYNETSIYL